MLYYGRNKDGRIRSVNVLERLCTLSTEWDEADCWEYLGKDAGRGGHKRIRLDDKKRIQVHRLAWEAYNAEPIPPNMFVLHKCDNPTCFNPNHLYLGSLKQNSADTSQRHPGWGLVSDPVVLADIASSSLSSSELGLKYGVTSARIRQIKKDPRFKTFPRQGKG
jgi:hypothetical protein